MTLLVRILAISVLAAAVSAEPAKVAGKWNVTLQLESITGHPVILLKQDGEKLTGTYESARYGQSELKGAIKEKEIDRTVKPISRDPLTAASIGVSPFSTCR